VHGVLGLGLVTVVTYACLREPVPLCASSDFSASSWCTAVEKRRQKLGSWTTIAATVDVCACGGGGGVSVWKDVVRVPRERASVAEAVFVVRGQVGSDGGTRLFAFACVCLLG
jgi:hypothetical protein